MKKDRIVIISIALCAIVMFGELMAYGHGPFHYDAEVTWNGDEMEYTVSSSTAETFSLILMDNGDVKAPEKLYIYINDSHDRFFDDALSKGNIFNANQQHSAKQIALSLAVRGFTNVEVLHEADLFEILNNDPLSGSPRGLLVMSYSLPSSVYNGNPDCPLIKWIENGGSLYWTGSEIGKFYHTEDELIQVTNNQLLFFGWNCVNTQGFDMANSVLDSNGLTHALSLKSNRVMYALNVDGLANSISLGFSEGGYSSISLVQKGAGMICVIGGWNMIPNKYDDISQVISSGITCTTTVAKIIEGEVIRGNINGTIETKGMGLNSPRVSILIGGYYTLYGESFNG